MAEKLSLNEASIPGFYIVDLVLNQDSRGWFKENYHKAKMEALGLPEFDVAQNNFSYNVERGVTRGLHGEPWEKYITVANGRVFGAWVDLRKGESFGQVLTLEITPEIAVFVPRGVANGYQTLEENVVYTYLVNEHWSADAQYTHINLFDPALGINWPISQADAVVSDKDKAQPYLVNVIPVEPSA
jgi:dTDP-4-dehydrorhamnose 3,5-epimerase